MAKFVNDSSMDAALAWVRDNTTNVSICSAQPTTATEAATTYALGSVAYGTANWTIGNGDTSGRKITAGAVNVVVATSGTVSHIAYYNTGTLVGVGTCAPTAVTSGGTFAIGAYDFNEIRDIA